MTGLSQKIQAPGVSYNIYSSAAAIAVFGGLWGVAEITLGTALHAIHMPFKGLTLTAIGMIIILTSSRIVYTRGLFISMGVVAGSIKLLSIAGVRFTPFISILSESVIVEIVILLLGVNILGFLLAASLACLYPLFHHLMGAWLFYGMDIFTVFLEYIQEMQNLLGLPAWGGMKILSIVALIYLTAGALAGLSAWKLSGYIQKRLGRTL